MKKILLITAVFLSFNFFAQKNYVPQNHNQRLGNGGFQTSQAFIGERDSFYTYGLDLNTGVWNLNTKVLNYVYDSLQRQISYVYQALNSGNWVNSQKYSYTFDANNNVTSQLLQYWTSGAWSNGHLNTFTYDTNNNRIHALYQGWTNAWVNQYQSTYTFNAHNNMTHQFYQSWSTGNNNWTNYETYTYSYDTTSNNMIYEIDSTWNGTAWQNSEQHFYTYDINHNKTTDSILNWNGSAWKTSGKVNFTYDANNNNTSFLYSAWDTTHFVQRNQLNYTYDINNILNLQMQQDFNTAGTALTDKDSTVFYYKTLAAICHSSISYTLTQNVAPQTWDAHPFYPTNVDSVRWYWGDGTFSTTLYPSHTYSVAGKYNICLTAYASCGDSTVYCQNDSIYRYANNSTLSNMVYVNVVKGGTPGPLAYQPLLADSITEFDAVGVCMLAKQQNSTQQTQSNCVDAHAYNTGFLNAWYAYGDSLHNGKNYKKVSYSNSFQGLIREDTAAKKIYFIQYCNTNEELLYNFSLSQGDTISYNFKYSNTFMTSGVFTVDSIRLQHDYQNYYRKHFYLQNHQAPNTSVLEMVEGIGSTTHPLFLYYNFYPDVYGTFPTCAAANFSQALSCKSNNGVKVYYDSCLYKIAVTHGNSWGDTCTYCWGITGGIEQNTDMESVTISPNPAQNNFTIQTNATTKQSLQIFDVNGRLALSQTITNNTNIDVSQLTQGIYNISITSNKGVVNKRLVIVK